MGYPWRKKFVKIIKRAVTTPENLGDLAVRLFSATYNGEELGLPRRETRAPLTFK